jgi:L-threonylcarbamoyladenylate synthase
MSFQTDITSSLEVLRKGGTILYPTDTIWGIGGDATSSKALVRIMEIKARSEGKSMIILVSNEDMLARYVGEIPQVAWQLIEADDAPLTIVYPEGRNLAEGICAADGSVGIRICRDEFCNELISRFRKPLISSSANISGSGFPATFADIDKELISSVDYVVKHRQEETVTHAPSPLIKIFKDGSIKILRK